MLWTRKILNLLIILNKQIQSRRNVKDCFIVHEGRHDGVGAQLHAMVSIKLFSKLFNLQYLHVPLLQVEHAKGDKKEWANKWEEFFSLGYNEIPYTPNIIQGHKIKFIKFPALLNKKSSTIFKAHNCHSFTDINPDNYLLILQELRDKYYLSPKVHFLKSGKTLKIAIHIRRGDVTKASAIYNRYTANDEIIKRLKFITGILAKMGINYSISIFSEGEEHDFEVFKCFQPAFFLNKDEFKTFHSLVTANVLIMAKSSFSYIAAILNEGIIMYDPFWHKPMKGWINFSETNTRTENLFLKHLKEKGYISEDN